MHSFINYHLYKIIYPAICILIVFCIIGFENNVNSDRAEAVTDSLITGSFVVESMPSRSNDMLTFTAKPTSGSVLREAALVRINHAGSLDICIGDRLRAAGSYSLPGSALNPGGFDYGDYLKSLGASVCFDTDVSQISSITKSPLARIYALRERITEKVAQYVSANEAGIITALICGNKDYIKDADAQNYRKSGIYHIVAVSGLHLNLFVLFLSFAYASLRLRGRSKAVVSFIVTAFACTFMLVFTGFGVSVARAAFMTAAFCVSGLVCREYSPFAGLFAVFALVLVFEPHLCRNISFCLSFSATAGILAGAQILKSHPPKPNRFKGAVESFVLTMCANLATIPFLVLYFGGVSLISPVSNLVVLAFCAPLLGVSYIFGALCLFAGDFVCSVLGYLLSGAAYAINSIAEFFASLPFAYISCSFGDVIFVYFLLVCAGAFAKFRKRAVRFTVAAIFVVANISFMAYNVFVNYSAIAFVNAGQGDCTLIYDTKGSAVMVDCGSEDAYSFAENEVIPFLGRKNIQKLDALFVTHFHTDHTSGVVPLIEAGYVKALILPSRALCDDEADIASEIYKAAAEHAVPVKHISEGDKIQIGDCVSFTVLSPSDAQYPSANEGSVVLRAETGGAKVLLCADIEEISQHNLLDKSQKYDIIKVPHHGGKSENSSAFFDAFECDYAVISCGRNNKYEHPHPDTLGALQGAKVLRTDTKGAPVEFIIKNTQIFER